MFGYVIANRDALTEEEIARYRGFYCGICATLKEKYGIGARMVLTYDMAFLAMLLSSLYEPETASRSAVCPAHPRTQQLFLANEYISYAADMNIALTYYKCLDDWNDDRSVVRRAQAKLLKARMSSIRAAWPRQLRAIEDGLKRLSDLEKAKDFSSDACAGAFGDILAELFVYKEDTWANALRETGGALGKFIYMMDAYEDLDKDAKKGAFNPLLPIRGAEGFEETAKALLTMLMGECVASFEQLPLVEDISILRNILYSGVWTKYNYLQTKTSKGKGTRQ